MKRKNLFPFFDMAYLGFVTGDIYEDSYPIFLFYDMGFEMFIAQSFSKCMGLYGERAGPLHVIVNDPSTLSNIKAQLGEIAKGIYLVPIGHGARIIKAMLKDEELTKDWLAELKQVVGRLNYVRDKLHQAVLKIESTRNWDHIKNQHGMFSYVGLTRIQCEALISKHKIFLVKTSRISLTGLNDGNIDKVAAAIKDVVVNY